MGLALVVVSFIVSARVSVVLFIASVRVSVLLLVRCLHIRQVEIFVTLLGTSLSNSSDTMLSRSGVENSTRSRGEVVPR